MTADEIHASAVIQAPAARVCSIIAGYRHGHARIVPPRYFKWIRVESGWVGAGTIVIVVIVV